MLDFAYFIVVIWGSVIVFGAWSTIQYDDAGKDMYCPAHAFNFAFYYLVFYWVFLPLACCCGMMACCCKAFAKCHHLKEKENKKNQQIILQKQCVIQLIQNYRISKEQNIKSILESNAIKI